MKFPLKREDIGVPLFISKSADEQVRACPKELFTGQTKGRNRLMFADYQGVLTEWGTAHQHDPRIPASDASPLSKHLCRATRGNPLGSAPLGSQPLWLCAAYAAPRDNTVLERQGDAKRLELEVRVAAIEKHLGIDKKIAA